MARPVDQRGKLDDEPFTYLVTKDGSVRISYGGRVVVTVGGDKGRRLATTLAARDGKSAQLVLAKATGNFKHGTERR